MPNRRPGTSLLLIGGAVVLLGSIMLGQRLGDRVLLQTERRVPIGAELVTPVPRTAPTHEGPIKNWKRLQVVSVATDPAFPDPRVTRPPEPTPRPYVPSRRRYKKVVTSPVATPTVLPATSAYTSPPLPLPLLTHGTTPVPEESGSPVPAASPIGP